MFCQHLAMDFRIFPNLSTLVNVCQRIPFHESDWYIGIYSLSTLSTPKCVHIILRRFVSKRGALNTFCHSWLLYVMSSYYDWVWKWKNPDVYVLVCLDFSAAWKSTASICYCDASNIFIQFLYKQIYGCGILFRRWIPLWNFNQYCFCILDGLSL